MKRNIITTIEFSNGHVSINVLEKLSTNEVEIFASRGPVAKAHSFLATSLNEIERRVGARIAEAVVVVEPNQQIDAKIEFVQESIRISGETVSQKDVENLLQLTKNKHTQNNRETILVQPLQFEVQDSGLRKKYLKAPIYKAGELLSASMAVTSLNSEAYDFIQSQVKAHDLEISQILLKPQTISQTNLSETALVSGAVLIHIGHHQAFITINKNNGTVDYVSFFDSGYKQLLQGIAKMFCCTLDEARELVTIYGSLAERQNRVIFTRQEGVREFAHTSNELTSIIQQYARRILILAGKYVEQKGVQSLPIVLSGEFSQTDGLEDYAKMILNRSVSTYAPMSYLEMNYSNHSTLGVMNLNQRLDGVLGKQLNTIVETNPNAFSTLNKKPRSLLNKLIDKIGGKYDYN